MKVRLVRGVPGLTDPDDVTSRRHHLARRVHGPTRAPDAFDAAREATVKALTIFVSAQQAREIDQEPDASFGYEAQAALNVAQQKLAAWLGGPAFRSLTSEDES